MEEVRRKEEAANSYGEKEVGAAEEEILIKEAEYQKTNLIRRKDFFVQFLKPFGLCIIFVWVLQFDSVYQIF